MKKKAYRTSSYRAFRVYLLSISLFISGIFLFLYASKPNPLNFQWRGANQREIIVLVAMSLVGYVWFFHQYRRSIFYRSWQLINSSYGLSGDCGRKSALQSLSNLGWSLSGVTVSNANLQFLNLSNANLEFSNFQNVNLHHSRFCRAKLFASKLRGADLRESSFYKADLENADLTAANGSNANFNGANLCQSRLENACFLNTQMAKARLFSSFCENVFFESSSLLRADFSRISGKSMRIIECDCRFMQANDANFERSYLKGSNFKSANFERANLSFASFNSCNLHRANLISSNLSHADLRGANLDGADLRGANLQNIRWDEKTAWHHAMGLEKAIALPAAWKAKSITGSKTRKIQYPMLER